jgi:hypothetical protein
MKSHVLVAALWTITFTFLFTWLIMFATANALQPPAGYVQHPEKCQVHPPLMGR